MNKKGFTLVELIAVIVLIALVSMLTFPSLKNLRKNHDERQWKTYEDMMVQYVKTIPNYKNRSYICLSELKNNGLKDINNSINCNGYVTIADNILSPFLSCSQNESKLYEKNGYDSSKCS